MIQYKHNTIMKIKFALNGTSHFINKYVNIYIEQIC